MALRNIRLFVISVIVVTTIIELPVSAFTINRAQDLYAQESSLDEQRADYTTPDVRVIEYQPEQYKIIAKQTPETIQREPVDGSVELTTAYLLLKTDSGYVKITGLPIYAQSKSATLPNQQPSDLPYDTTEVLRERREKRKQNATTVSTDTVSIFTTEQESKVTTPETSTIEQINTNTNDTTTMNNVAELTTGTIVDVIKSTDGISTIDAGTEYSYTSDQTSPETTTSENYISSDATSIVGAEELTTGILSDYTTIDTSPTTIVETTYKDMQTASSEVASAETSAPTNVDSITPPWKKYTTIDRKKSSATTSSENSKERDTEPTRISLGKLLNESPIQSIGKLGEELLLDSISTHIPDEIDVTKSRVGQVSVKTPEITTTRFTTSPTTERPSLRTLQLTSMRAGFLDYSAKPIAEEATTIIESFQTLKFNDTERYAGFEAETMEPDILHENKIYTASRSQLADDVLKEELLREETLSNNEDNDRYRSQGDEVIFKDNDGKNAPGKSEYTTQGQKNEFVQELTTEDLLRVKPIDKNTLYSISSNNYKPAKKIEVLPSKPFIRNPDDNSWRNESISSLGIVFKAKQPAKNYTQVLKNKTETLLSGSLEKDSKDGTPDLRERLEKIAEVRKSKKKKVIDKFGDTVYGDYEENVNSAETTSASSPVDTTTVIIPDQKVITKYIYTNPQTTTSVLNQLYGFKNKDLELTTTKPKKHKNVLEYYDTTDEYDAEYVNLPKIDLKKFTSRLPPKDLHATTIPTSQFTKPVTSYWPDRRPTLQYFPPRVSQKANINDYDSEVIKNKNNYYTYKNTKNIVPATYETIPIPPLSQAKHQTPETKSHTVLPLDYTRVYRPVNVEKNVYNHIPEPQRTMDSPQSNGYGVPNDGNYNRASYVIKHYKDFVDLAARDADYDKNGGYDSDAYTRLPVQGVTANELAREQGRQNSEEEDYEAQFHKVILNRFVDNFNQNSERFKVDFPILYNNSVVHRKPEESGRALATSSAFLKRLYEEHGNSATKGDNYLIPRACEHCDNITVELSPAYELHYYVPEQEEREEAEPRVTGSYRYAL